MIKDYMEKQNEYNQKHAGAKDYEKKMQKLDEEVEKLLKSNNEMEVNVIPDLKQKVADFDKKLKDGKGK